MASLYPFISEMFPYRPPSDRPDSGGAELTTFVPKDQTKRFQAHFLVHFSPRELATLAMTCKFLKMMVNSSRVWDRFHLEEMFPLKIVDEADWKKQVDLDGFNLSFKGLGPIDKRLAIPQIVKFFADLRKIGRQVPQGATLLAMPSGSSVPVVDKCFPFLGAVKEHKRLFPSKIALPYRLLITNSCLPGTVEWEHDHKRSFVKEIEFRLPTFIEIRVMQGFPNIPFPSALCAETLRDPRLTRIGEYDLISVVSHKDGEKAGLTVARDLKYH